MVLIGYSGVKEPKPSYFWNAWSACTAERWKMDAVNESERISKMERPVLIEYITDLTTSHSVSAIVNMGKQFSDLKRIGAEEIFYPTMKCLFDKLRLRLYETVGDVDQTNEDIISIETVMDENISTANFTALFLVYQHMVRHEKLEAELEPASQRSTRRKNQNLIYNKHLNGFKKWLIEKCGIPQTEMWNTSESGADQVQTLAQIRLKLWLRSGSDR